MDFINFTRNFKQQLEKVQHDSVAKIKILTVKSTGPGMEDPTHLKKKVKSNEIKDELDFT